MAHLLDDLGAIHVRALAALDQEYAALEGIASDLRRQIGIIEQQIEGVSQRRKLLKSAEANYREALNPTQYVVASTRSLAQFEPVVPSATDDKARPSGTVRARIGTQRYRILKSLEALGPLDRSEIAEFTGLDRRRIKDQVSDDLDAGVVEVAEGGKIFLTTAGNDLLSRFETSRTSRGLPLPPLDDVSTNGGEEGFQDRKSVETDAE